MSEKEDLTLEALMDFFDAVEAGIAQAKHHLKEAKAPEKYDITKISWEQAQGLSGPYEKSSSVDNLDFKNLLKDVQAHGGRMTVGEYFVWAFKNGATIGRKKRRAKGEQDNPIAKEPSQNAEGIAAKFPEDLRGILRFECQADVVIITPRQFLGSENFAKIAGIVRELGGQYVSEGKNSRFELPLQK